MTDSSDSRTVALKDLRSALAELRLATKDDLEAFETRLRRDMVTKDEARNFATKDDLKKFATKDDLKKLASKKDLKKLEGTVGRLVTEVIAHKMKLEEMATKTELAEFREYVADKLDWLASKYQTVDRDYFRLENKTNMLGLMAVNHNSDLEKLKNQAGLGHLRPVVTKEGHAGPLVRQITDRMKGIEGICERRGVYSVNKRGRRRSRR